MSKPWYKTKKSETPLIVAKNAKELAKYLMIITANEKAFPRAYRNVLCNLIREYAVKLYSDISSTIAIPLNTEERAIKVLTIQEGIQLDFIKLSSMVNIASDITKLSNPQHLAKLLTDVDTSIDSWIHYVKRKRNRLNQLAYMTDLEKFQERDEFVQRMMHYKAQRLPHDADGFVILQKNVRSQIAS